MPLPKSVTAGRIVENADVYDFEIEDGDLEGLDGGGYEPVCWDPTKEALDK